MCSAPDGHSRIEKPGIVTGLFYVRDVAQGFFIVSGIGAVVACRNCSIAEISPALRSRPSCTLAIMRMASLNLATEPSWKYGAVCAAWRIGGTLKIGRAHV